MVEIKQERGGNMKKILMALSFVLIAGCSDKEVYQEQNNTDLVIDQVENTEAEFEPETLKEESSNNVEPESLYLENSIRKDIDDGLYLKLGEPMEFYLKNTDGEQFSYYNIKPIEYITKLEKGNDYDGDQWYQDIHFIFEVTDVDEQINIEEKGEIINNFNELIDAKLFLDDINLGKYFYGTVLEDGSNFKKVARYTNLIKIDSEEFYSCYAPGASGLNEETGVRTCSLSFSYAGPGEYLLAMSDGAGGVKNYLIDIE